MSDVTQPARKSGRLRTWWRDTIRNPINQRRLELFKANRRGYWSFWLFLGLFIFSLLANFIANDRPLLVWYKGELLSPVLVDYPEEKFGGFYAQTDYRDAEIQKEISDNGWALWPPISYDYRTLNLNPPGPAPTKPSWMMSKEERCKEMPNGVNDVNCTIGNWNWLGTDGNSRDVMARVIYGFRISAIFGLVLTIISSAIGIAAGAVQGYFGGRVDLYFQRVIELWTSMPQLFILLIIASLVPPGFWILLGILLLFSWVSLVGVVRAEFLRGRNFDYVRAARALGLSDWRIMTKHLLPNAMVATVTFMPFILSGSLVTLTALDFLGLGLPVGSASLGELLAQGKNNLHAPWLVITAFCTVFLMLALLVFTGEAVRDALDPRKTFK